ncbi:acyl-CoA dehydrogenase family protein [Phytohabitans kaempferiae]|uniref:Acyl-CoA dehydrogenase family protein n=1 Tax=Phytohabitans kaempferiae TaxID=1620943 RepID=A0ABV6MF86_9ACTN
MRADTTASVLVLDEEQRAIAQTVREFVAQEEPVSAVRERIESGSYDPAVWRRAAALGLPGIALPAEYGGAGLGAVEMAAVFEAAGEHLALPALLPTVGFVGTALVEVDGLGACPDVVRGIAAGTTTAALVLGGTGTPYQAAPAARARALGGTPRLSGHAGAVTGAAEADVLLVLAEEEDGPGLYLTPGDADGVTRRRLTTLDLTRPVAEVRLQDAPAVRVAGGDAVVRGLSRALATATVLLAAEQVGAASRCLDMSVEYARTRVQFGRPIGSFQAVKHLCADMLIALEEARSVVYHARYLAGESDPALPAAASMAKVKASEAFLRIARSCLQVHGGIGFTWEHDAHLYLRRAKASQLSLGSPAAHVEFLADQIGVRVPGPALAGNDSLRRQST